MASTRGQEGSVGRDGRRQSFLANPANLSLIVVLTLAAGSILGGVYVLGRALSPSEQVQDPLSVSAPPDTRPTHATTPGNPPAPPSRSATSPSPTPTESVRETTPADDRPRLALERGGPYGARLTSGSADVALTFDDGPDPSYTPQVLDLLAEYQVKATFCMVGEQAAAHPELVRAIVAAGHTLCNHSWSHDLTLGSRSRTAIRSDLARTNAAISAAVPGTRIVYFRQPGGAWTSNVVGAAWELGMTSLHWAVDPRDWTQPGAGSIASTVTAGVRAGSIVLMHDSGGDRQQTVNALHTILPNLLRRFELSSLPTGPPSTSTDNTGATASGAPRLDTSVRTPDPSAGATEPSAAAVR
ncbi:polysaccharide deacetylase [Micromonospora pisi]|uniref:Polysaccharide deacetylase n=1 Tax=Micromonospora pisi TaxID=589240 RepID=A0A495JKG9_9ACTN|nr:polysaccharide deacetylase family protein [Micromonospora pisi]RKR88832.1 polysaccharide deacetylase [Micromonospora pisi]